MVSYDLWAHMIYVAGVTYSYKLDSTGGEGGRQHTLYNLCRLSVKKYQQLQQTCL